jgi:glutamate racemase
VDTVVLGCTHYPFLQGEIAEMSITLAEKVVGRSLDGKAQKELVESYIKELAGMGGNGSTTS